MQFRQKGNCCFIFFFCFIEFPGMQLIWARAAKHDYWQQKVSMLVKFTKITEKITIIAMFSEMLPTIMITKF